jgi:CheY-like chemotaxis protein
MDIFSRSLDKVKDRNDPKDKLDSKVEVPRDTFDFHNSDFLMSAFMEISSVLTVIGGYTSLLLEGETGALNAAQSESITHIKQSSKLMFNLTQDLVDVIRLQSGQWEFHKGELDFKELVTGTWGYYRDKIVKKGIKIDGKIEGDKCIVFGDRDALKKALLRIFGNSILFCQKGTNIFLSIVKEGDDTWVISIRDNGPGVTEAEFPHLFTPFYTYKNLETSEAEFNLGLSLVLGRLIMNNHGGELWVETEPGKGTTIFLTLPSPRAPGRKKILIIEDNTIIAMMYETKLKKIYNVTIAHSGKEGLEKARIEKPDLIILDILMPEMDGFGVCRELKRNQLLKDIPVVFLSNLIQSNLLKQVKEVGALDLLHKSNITPSNLADKIREIFKVLEPR